jgi:HK97 family phage portal protein
MAIFQRLLAAAGYIPMPMDDPRAWTDGKANPVAQSGVVVTAAAALQLGVIQAVQEVLAGSISTLPFMVFERLPNGEKRAATELPIYRVLHTRPNARQTAQEFRDEMQRHLSVWRNCYARIESDGGQPISGLDPIHPERVAKIERMADGRVYYTINPVGTGTIETLRDDQIWHIRKAPLTLDGLRGLPVWETGREEIGRALAVEYYGARYFKNSGKGGGVLKHPGKFATKLDRDEFWEAWRMRSTGEMQHSDRLLTHGVEYVAANLNNDEAQFIETLRQCEVKVARLWQMPPHRVGILDRATNNNIEHQGIDYVVHTLAPWVAAWEQAASRDLLIGEQQDRFFAEINVAGLLRGDIMSRYRAYAQGRQWGWLSVNDIRRLENQAGIGPAGDRYLEAVNMRQAGESDEPRDNA